MLELFSTIWQLSISVDFCPSKNNENISVSKIGFCFTVLISTISTIFSFFWNISRCSNFEFWGNKRKQRKRKKQYRSNWISAFGRQWNEPIHLMIKETIFSWIIFSFKQCQNTIRESPHLVLTCATFTNSFLF